MRWVAPFAAVVILGTGLFAARALSETPPAGASAPPRALPVQTAAPEAASGYVRERILTGEVRPRQTAALGFEGAGRVVEVAVDEGDGVAEGALLARIDVSKLDAERAALVAGRAEAQAVLDEMRAGPRAETVRAAAAVVAELEAERALLVKKRERRAELLREQTIADEEFDEVLTRLASVTARLEGARSRLAELEAGTREETLRAQEARVQALEARIARLDLDRADARLEAPFAGRVQRREIDAGSIAVPGLTAIVLVEDAAPQAWIGVPPAAAAHLERGERHPVTVGEHAFEAVVVAVLPLADPTTRTRTVVLDLPAEAAGLFGRVARLGLDERVEAEGFWVPATALVRGVRGLWAVYAVEPDDGGAERVVRHAVEVLHVGAERVFVRGTLAPGARLVVGNTERVAPGQRVEAIAAASAEG